MVLITVKKGLDIPVEGAPILLQTAEFERLAPSKEISLNLNPFEYTKFKLLLKAGDVCQLGQPLVVDKKHPSVKYVAPAGGKIKEIRRGLKRRLLDIVIEVDSKEERLEHKPLQLKDADRNAILERLSEGGAMAHIRRRPYDLPANPSVKPRAIFVDASVSAPFAPSASLEVSGHESAFQMGLSALAKLTDGTVHLVHREEDQTAAFTGAKNVSVHTVSGPHPSGNVSVHIHAIDPIKNIDDVVWTLDVNAVITVGELLERGIYHTDRVISIAGPGIVPEKRAFVRGRQGQSIGSLIAGRNEKGLLRMVSGGPLMGEKVEVDDFLHFFDTTFTVIPENVSREFLHFFRLGLDKFSTHRAYLSGHSAPDSKTFSFSTTQHGEHRNIVDGAVYEKVMPLPIPVLPLMRAVQGGDLELAEDLGLLEVAPEDFALTSFICPSKTDMVKIIKNALHEHALENMS